MALLCARIKNFTRVEQELRDDPEFDKKVSCVTQSNILL